MMPAYSERQRRYMGADLARAERGERTETGMSKEQLRDFARKGKRKSSRSNRRSMRRGR